MAQVYTINLASGSDPAKPPAGTTSIVFELGNVCTTLQAEFTSDCSDTLTSIDFTNATDLKTIERNAFLDCSKLIGSLTLPSGLRSIGGAAFYGCSGFTGGLTLPSSLQTISISAFRDCSGFNGGLTIPSSLQTIGGYAFQNCSGFSTLSLNSNTIDILDNTSFAFGVASPGINLLYNGNYYTATNLPPISEDGSAPYYTADYYNNGVIDDPTRYVVPATPQIAAPARSGTISIVFASDSQVTTLPVNFASACTDTLTSIDFTNATSLQSIGASAFNDCTGITGSLDLSPCTVLTSIGDSAFSDCSGFTGTLTFPSSLTSIGGDAFYGCSGFTGSLDLSNSLTSIGSYAFSDCSGFTGSLDLSNSLTSIGSYAFGYTNFTGPLTLPSSLTSIGNSAFLNCPFKTLYLNSTTGIITIGNTNTFGFFDNSTPENALNLYYNGTQYTADNLPPIYSPTAHNLFSVGPQYTAYYYNYGNIYNPDVPCYSRGTKILTTHKGYIPVEELKEGDLIKTYLHGDLPIENIMSNKIMNDPDNFKHCLYRLKSNNPEFEDLVVTGAHAILVSELPEDVVSPSEGYYKSTESEIDDKYLLVAAFTKEFEKINEIIPIEYYHFNLKSHDGTDRRYGVWANGVLSESTFRSTIDKNLE